MTQFCLQLKCRNTFSEILLELEFLEWYVLIDCLQIALLYLLWLQYICHFLFVLWISWVCSLHKRLASCIIVKPWHNLLIRDITWFLITLEESVLSMMILQSALPQPWIRYPCSLPALPLCMYLSTRLWVPSSWDGKISRGLGWGLVCR